MLVIGLAPGLQGANATGRPFTGDYAGEVLYAGLKKHGFARGDYNPAAFGVGRGADNKTANFAISEVYPDGFTLHNVRITNAVRCVPPENKPTPLEEKTCNPFLVSELSAMPNLRLILCLGLTSHNAVLRTLKLKAKDYKFAHGAVHEVGQGLRLLNSYHTSRYNISTGRLTQAMFDEIIAKARTSLT